MQKIPALPLQPSGPSAAATAAPAEGAAADREPGYARNLWVPLLLLLGLAGQAGMAPAAVWIEFYDGERDAYRLHRDRERLPIAIYQDLQKGDRLSVDQPGLSLWLKRDDGTTEVLTSRNSPYWVEDGGKAPGVLDQLLAFAGEFLSIGMDDGSARPSVVTAGSRGDEPEPPRPVRFPLAPSGTARLGEGPRPLRLFWVGGEPPVRVRLLREGATEPLLELSLRDLAGNAERRLELPRMRLRPGPHVLELRDARRRIRIDLEIVAAAALPRPSADLGPDEQDPLRANLYAIWLASQGDEWVLEAYQRAKALAAEHRPARAFGYSLEAGRRPPGAGPATERKDRRPAE